MCGGSWCACGIGPFGFGVCIGEGPALDDDALGKESLYETLVFSELVFQVGGVR